MDLFAQVKKSTLIHALFAISFFVSGLLINLAQLVIFIFVKPFNKRLFRQLLYYLCFSFHSQLLFMAVWWSGCKLNVFIDPEVLKKNVGNEHVLLLMNHCYEIDWLMGWMFCDYAHVLGNCKAYAKKAISYIPTVGWSWKFSEFIFLERNYDKDKVAIETQLNELLDYPSPMWLLLNAEGTRFTKTKHEASVKFAREHGMPELKHHLLPRTKGFSLSVPHMLGRNIAIYDIQLAIPKDAKVAPTLSNILLGKSIEADMLVRRIPVEDIPRDEEECGKWLHAQFVNKDKIQDSFHKHGDFFHDTGVEKLKPFRIGKNPALLINTLGWAIFIIPPMIYYVLSSLIHGNFITFGICVSILFAFYFLMQKSIGMSKISKASSYGATTPSTPIK